MKGEPITVIPSRPPPLSDKTAQELTAAVDSLRDQISVMSADTTLSRLIESVESLIATRADDRTTISLIESIESLKDTVREQRDAITSSSTPIDTQELITLIGTTNELLSDLIVTQKEPHTPEKTKITMSYPESGKKTLSTGITKINIKSKQVFLADGTTEEMYATRPLQTAKSATLYADKAISVTLSLRGSVVQKTGIFESWTRFQIEFDLIEITTTMDTSFYVQLSDSKESINRNR